jgi:predicted RNA-binding protein with PUA-like domain
MQQMSVGDEVFVYHSGKERAIVGIGTVVQNAHPDSTDQTGVWACADIASVSKLTNPVTLGDIKRVPALKDMVLVNNSRLSVQPVREQEWKKILEMSGV